MIGDAMDEAQQEKVQRFFAEALERDPQDRSAFLTGVCGTDSEVLVEVESLLAHHSAAERSRFPGQLPESVP